MAERRRRSSGTRSKGAAEKKAAVIDEARPSAEPDGLEVRKRSVTFPLGIDYYPLDAERQGFADWYTGDIEAVAVHQTACFEAAVQFARAEGILPAPESSHAIRAAIDEALAAQAAGEDKVILFNLSGHGHFDLAAYAAYNSGELRDFDYAQGTTLCAGE